MSGPAACTVSGLVTQRLGRFPHVGDALTLNGWELRVEEMAGTRVTRMKLTRRINCGKIPFAETDVPTANNERQRALEFVE